MATKDIRQNDMMAHLMDALEQGTDIGHYGRLVFAMVGKYFLSEDELVSLLSKNPGFDEKQARALYHQVSQNNYNPPRREKILQWQKEQDFPICPNGDDPDSCNLYKNLRFPDGVYDDIQEYHMQKAETESAGR